jgi:hypothetical protein
MKEPLEWEKEFTQCVSKQHFGNAGWGKLKSAGLGEFTKYLLYEFYRFGISEPPKIGLGLDKINRNLEKLKYSDKVAREKQRHLDAKKFEYKYERARESTSNAEWPFRNEQVRTFGSAVVAYPPLGMLTFEHVRAAIGDGRQALESYAGKTLLVVLRAGAKARAIRLSLSELSELAYCANDGLGPIERQALHRFFSYPDIKRIENAFRRQFESTEDWDLFRIAEAVIQEITSSPSDPFQNK